MMEAVKQGLLPKSEIRRCISQLKQARSLGRLLGKMRMVPVIDRLLKEAVLL